MPSYIVSERRLGEPRTSRELFDLLERDGWLPGTLTATLRNMVGFRTFSCTDTTTSGLRSCAMSSRPTSMTCSISSV
jgi:hypothetical protein